MGDRVKRQQMLAKVGIALSSVIFGLIIGAILISLIGINPITGYSKMITTSFSNLGNISDILNVAIPLSLTGFSVAFAYKAGLFNIGAEGQFLVGIISAIFVGTLDFGQMGAVQPVASICAGMLGGALWALIPGLLKAYLRVNEVVVTILMNLIAVKSITIIVSTWFHGSNTTATPDILPSAQIFLGNSEFTIGLFIVPIVAILFWFVLKRTQFGFEIKAVGTSAHAARYAGVDAKKRIIQTMLIAGALSGLAGAIYGLELGKFSELGNFTNYGFNGIVVAMLGNLAMIGVIFAALLIAFFSVAYKFISLSLPQEIADIIIGIIFITSSIGSIYSAKIIKKLRKKNKEK